MGRRASARLAQDMITDPSELISIAARRGCVCMFDESKLAPNLGGNTAKQQLWIVDAGEAGG